MEELQGGLHDGLAALLPDLGLVPPFASILTGQAAPILQLLLQHANACLFEPVEEAHAVTC